MDNDKLAREQAHGGHAKSTHIIRKRGAQRGVVTKMINNLNSNELDDDEVKGIMETLTEKMTKIKLMDEEIENTMLDADEDIEDECMKSGDFTLLIKTNIARCHSLLNKNKTEDAPRETNRRNTNNVKLPRIEIPQFYGDLTKWHSFWDLFKTLIDSNNDITTVEKFSYLKSLLKSKALLSIEGLSLTACNYEHAKELLLEKYDNKQTVVNKHMQLFMSLTALKDETILSLRSFYDRLTSNIRSLESLGVNLESYDGLLLPIIMQKLPDRLVLQLSQSAGYVTISNILRELNKYILLKEQISIYAVENKTKSFTNENETKIHNDNNKSFANSIENKKFSCVFCDSCSHYPINCTNVQDINKRRNILKEKNLCMNCLNASHSVKECRSQSRCKNCNLNHHSSICMATKPHTLLTSVNTSVLLSTAISSVAKVNSSNTVRARILFDEGSQKSFITKNLANRLCLEPSRTITLSTNVFGGTQNNICEANVFEINVINGEATKLIELIEINNICAPLRYKSTLEEIKQKYTFLNKLDLADNFTTDDIHIDILLGTNIMWKFKTARVIVNEIGPSAFLTTFGWVVSGPISDNELNNDVQNNALVVNIKNSNNIQTEFNIEKFWNLESVGICQDDIAETRVFLKESIVISDNRFKINLPWNDKVFLLKSHFMLAKSRLISLIRKLSKTPNALKEYHETICEQVKNGILDDYDTVFGCGFIARDLQCDKDSALTRCCFVPHHGVTKENSTTRLRVVLDGSAKSGINDLCINDCLYKGANLLPQLYFILLNFRYGSYALCGDIEKAFSQILVDQVDVAKQCMLWVQNIHNINVNTNIDIRVLCYRRLVFGYSCSPYILNECINTYLANSEFSNNEQNKRVATLIKNSIYVDNLAITTNDYDEANEIFTSTRAIFSGVSMNMRNWFINDQTLQNKFISVEKIKNFDPNTKVLGIQWYTESDELSLKLDFFDIALTKDITKRYVLHIISKVYDPLGLLSPLSTKLRLLMQKIWILKYEWDDILDKTLTTEFQNICADIASSNTFRISRSYIDVNLYNEIKQIDLHFFSDASNQAYSTVVYIHVTLSNSTTCTRLLTAKSRLCPLEKGYTIPKLELMGALLSARLNFSLKDNLRFQITSKYFWTDSMTVLAWIQNSNKCKTLFVENRLKEIREKTNTMYWNYCPGELNPADKNSRGCLLSTLINDKLWWNGPHFLTNKTEFLNKSTFFDNNTCLQTLTVATSEVIPILDIKRFSSFKMLLRVTGFILKFVAITRSHTTKSFAFYYDNAEHYWIKTVQRQYFSDEYEAICKGKNTSLTKKYFLYLDEDIIKSRGRIQKSVLTKPNAINPIMLPYSSHLSYIITLYSHEKVFHSGVRDTLAYLSEKFWILKGRKLVRSIVDKCVTCRKLRNIKYKYPDMSPLPDSRVNISAPFANTGIDFAGPFFVYFNEPVLSKCYLLLFTCCASRAVHVELTQSLSLHDFLNAFKKFISRRGIPNVVYSDNGTTFVGAQRSIKKLVSKLYLDYKNTRHEVEWKFNVPLASWWGGFFERMIGIVKCSLQKVIGQHNLSYDDFYTLLIEIEFMINNRPISYYYLDEETLTPFHLMHGRRNLWHKTEEVREVSTAKRYRLTNELIDQYWIVWSKSYLLELREHQKNMSQGTMKPKEGDVVLLQDSNPLKKKRMLWKLALIKKLIKGKDDFIRAVEVEYMTDGIRKQTERPLQMILPLEAECHE